VRYHVFKGVPWSHLPLYTLNKAAAWAGLVLMFSGAWRAAREKSDPVGHAYFRQGVALAWAHVFASLVLFGPVNYPDLFDTGARLTAPAEVALLAGVIGTVALTGVRRSQVWVILLPAVAAVHTAFLGARNWIAPGKWPGHLVPITLWSFLAAVALFAVVIGGGPRARR
jgi:hypothetical protein